MNAEIRPLETTAQDMTNAIRFLAADAVQAANSGHPGAPLGMAEIAWVLWTRHPQDPELYERLQGWLEESGLEAVEIETSGDAKFGVGLNRLVAEPPAFELGQHLFTFTR